MSRLYNAHRKTAQAMHGGSGVREQRPAYRVDIRAAVTVGRRIAEPASGSLTPRPARSHTAGRRALDHQHRDIQPWPPRDLTGLRVVIAL